MKKKEIVIISSFISLLVLAVFVFIIFSKKKTINIEVQNLTNNSQELEINNQEILISDQEAVNNSQETLNDEQQEPDNNQKNKVADEIKSSDGKIVDRFVSWGFQKASGRKIDTIIIHSTYDLLGNDPYSIDRIIAEYKQYGVNPHYLIARDGTIYHLVADQNIAYHAGVSKMPDGRTDVNDFSIGIEMANTTDGKFTNDQYAALNQLISSLKKQYSIKYILGHSDIASGRKTDPWNIEWDKVDK